MTSTLAVAREFLERALSQARSRTDYHLIGERICELMEMQELDELRMLRTAQTEHPVTRQERRARGMMPRSTR